MRTLLAFTVDGTPAPQGSKTIGNAAGRAFVREDNRATEPWRNAVAWSARRAMDGRRPMEGPLRLVLVFTFGRPRSHYGTGRNAGRLRPSAPVFHDRRPDLDKLVRAVGDALTGIAVVDDAAFVELVASKRYGSPGVSVTVRAV